MVISNPQKKAMLLCEASRWIGTLELPGNSGELVRLFQLSVGNKASGESWCLAFIQFCVKHVDSLCLTAFGDMGGAFLPPTESSQELWKLTPAIKKYSAPSPGRIAVWQIKEDPSKGHVGLVRVVKSDTFETIEGNTHADGVTNGPEGVYNRTRHFDSRGSFQLLGFIEPWN